MEKWKRFLRRSWCWLGALLTLGVLYLLVSLIAGRVQTQTSPPGDLTLQEVRLLKEYHGAYVVKREGGRWYFLGPHKRHWYPLLTQTACQDLKLPCPQLTSSAR